MAIAVGAIDDNAWFAPDRIVYVKEPPAVGCNDRRCPELRHDAAATEVGRAGLLGQ